MSEPYDVLALDVDGAVQVTGLPKGTLRSWHSAGIIQSSFDDLADESGRDIYGFRDLLNLRALANLRRDLGLRTEDLGRAGRYLARHRDTPWSDLGFGALGRQLVLLDPVTGRWESDHPDEVRSIDLMELIEDVRRRVDAALQRSPEQFGQVERHRGVLGNEPVIAGTRIPVVAIHELSNAGYSTQAIIDAYPHLQVVDVEAALAYASSADVA